MTLKGHIENGNIVLDHPVELPEGTEVNIEVLEASPNYKISPDIARFMGIIKLPEGMDYRQAYYEGRFGKSG